MRDPIDEASSIVGLTLMLGLLVGAVWILKSLGLIGNPSGSPQGSGTASSDKNGGSTLSAPRAILGSVAQHIFGPPAGTPPNVDPATVWSEVTTGQKTFWEWLSAAWAKNVKDAIYGPSTMTSTTGTIGDGTLTSDYDSGEPWGPDAGVEAGYNPTGV